MSWPCCERPVLSKRLSRVLHRLLFMMLLLTLTACSVVGDITRVEAVKPWQRGVLARDDMQLINDALEQSVDDHLYFSREGSTGGVSIQGGGCGCN